MAFFTSNPLQQTQPFSLSLCKHQWTLNSFNFHFPSRSLTFSPPKHALQQAYSPPLVVRAHVSHTEINSLSTDEELSHNTMNHRNSRRKSSGFSQFRAGDKRVGRKCVRKNVGSVTRVREDRFPGERLDSRKKREIGSGFSSMRSKDENLVKKVAETIGSELVNEEDKRSKKDFDDISGAAKKAKKIKVDSEEGILRVGLDMCSKKGDVMGALKLFDSAKREGIKMGQYHYSVLLYLCSSAATGVVRPAKSGSGGRSLSTVESNSEISTVDSEDLVEVAKICKRDFLDTESNDLISSSGLSVESINHGINPNRIELDSNGFLTEVGKDILQGSVDGKKLVHLGYGVANTDPQILDGEVHLGSDYHSKSIKDGNRAENYDIRVTEDFKKYALQRGFEIYEKMCSEKVPMNEASLTSIARMALAMGDGDMAFDTVKQMKELGINPRLRSYGPALSAFCNCGEIEKAFAVEEHMLKHGVHPEEPELEALLRVSVEAARSEKVYYLLHKLRTIVRKVSVSTADLLEKWFKSKVASKVGKRKWDQTLIREAMENGGGGWHGQGWLGKGKWTVSRTSVGADGVCKCCGEMLATIDLDPIETEKFAASVACIATQREKDSSFEKFQKWLDYYGPFEAVVDGANIGLFKWKFHPSKVNAVVNGIRQLLPSKKWPLIVLHNRHLVGPHIERPLNKFFIEKWKNADAIYATPTRSNDDWYWLYAAIKFKCLIVTNDEMRDHLFQLLGNDFFPKWKERHQVHFSFSDGSPVFHMPPPCSVVIQESEKGHWHIPIISEHGFEGERTWLCVTRNLPEITKVTATVHEELQLPLHKRGSSSDTSTKTEAELTLLNHGISKHPPLEIYGNLRNIFSTSVFPKHPTILPQIEAAEQLGGCVIDFEI